MEKYTVTFTIKRMDNSGAKLTYEYDTKQRAREAYEAIAMDLIDRAKKGEIKDFTVSRSRNTGF